MSSSTITSRLDALKSKNVIIEFKEAKTPVPSADILQLFADNTAARSDSSNEWIIDVFPNFTPILMYIMLNAIRHANATAQREHSKSSVATICMYHLSIVYGFFLINDLNVRPAPSAHARIWAESNWRSEFVKFLSTLPVPEFLIPILSQFHAFETARTKNVFFIPSAAGYDHDQFFGRVYPLNMFAAIHDCTATLPGNSSKIDVLRDLYSRVLYSITDPAYTCVIPDLIGITLSAADITQAQYMNSKLYQVFSSVINPVLFRDFQRRSSLAALSFKAPTFASANVNAYDLMFSATSANLRELKVVLQSVHAVISDDVSCKTSLGQFIADATTSTIIKHGYSTYALPTWSHSEVTNKAQTFRAITAQQLISEDARAQDFCFLQRPTAEIPHTHNLEDVRYVRTDAPTEPVALPQNHSIIRNFPLCLRNNTNAAVFPRVDNNTLINFSEEIHTVPSVLVLDTDGDQTITAHLPLLAGKIIESFELDGTTIEMPNAMKSLGMQNCMFADSAIPYKYVRPGSAYHPVNAGTILPPRSRATPNSTPRLPASSFLYNRLRVNLPRFNLAINEERIGNILPGMTLLDGVTVLRYVQSFLGFNTVSRADNADNGDNVPAMPRNLLLVWSPYTYTPYESDDLPEPALGESRHYYLTNLRTIFGTDYNLVQAKHPYESLPVV
nr:MAG: coat protein [Cannabis cryptic virus]